MDDEKQTAIDRYFDEQAEKAKEKFQHDVNAVLNEITSLTQHLYAAKNKLKSLEWKEPQRPSLD